MEVHMKLDTETQTNIKALIAIRDDPNTPPAVCIQAIQTMQKIIDSASIASKADTPTASDIMEKIRADLASGKKTTKRKEG